MLLVKTMKTNKQSNHNRPKQNKQGKSSSGTMKIFYIVMLLLIASSSLIRFASAGLRNRQGVATPTSESVPVGSGGTAARTFVYQRVGDGSSECIDLTITATGNAVYSNCGKGVEKQYALSDTERANVQGWIKQFQPVNYDHTDETQAGNVTTQLYLNGQGSQQADDAAIQRMIAFAETLAAKLAAQP